MNKTETTKFNSRDINHWFPDPEVRKLAAAACHGDTKAVGHSISSGTSPDASGVEGLTVLSWAVICENDNGVRALLDGGANPNKKIGTLVSSALYIAVSNRDRHLTGLLLQRGATTPSFDLGSAQSDIQVAIWDAVESKDWSVYYLLLNHLNINQPLANNGDNIGEMLATALQYDKIIELLENKGFSYDLQGLGRIMENIKFKDGSASDLRRQKILGLLREKGVQFPVGPIKPRHLPPEELPSLPVELGGSAP